MYLSKATPLLFKFIMAPKEKHTGILQGADSPASCSFIPMPAAHKHGLALSASRSGVSSEGQLALRKGKRGLKLACCTRSSEELRH